MTALARASCSLFPYSPQSTALRRLYLSFRELAREPLAFVQVAIVRHKTDETAPGYAFAPRTAVRLDALWMVVNIRVLSILRRPIFRVPKKGP